MDIPEQEKDDEKELNDQTNQLKEDMKSKTQHPHIKKIKCGECTRELMFERNMATHYFLDHPSAVLPQIKTWNENDDIPEQPHETNLINLTMN